MEFYIRANGVDEPEVCAGIVRHPSPTFTDQPVCSAVKHHGVARTQLFSEKRCLKVVGQITDAFEGGALGWVDRYSKRQSDIHQRGPRQHHSTNGTTELPGQGCLAGSLYAAH